MAEDSGITFAPDVSETAALGVLPDWLRGWFSQRFGAPTAAQRAAWPVVASGRHLLLAAPTGTGKTLAAFVPLIASSCDGPVSRGVRNLYVSPLKALGNDVRRTLRTSLAGLAGFRPGDRPLPRVGLRTGDTPPAARGQLWTEPPDILLTTPESLALLLTHERADDLFAGLRCVVVDEIHSLAATKRGADLSLSLERLEKLTAAPFQRIGLSATATPLDLSARFLVGEGRPCTVAAVYDASPLELTVLPLSTGVGFLAQLVEQVLPELNEERSVLIFTNTRGLAERLSWLVRRRRPEWDDRIAVHHSSLAAARRRHVEWQFKRGRLRAVVSSTSLELGIDVGAVDLVILVHPPGDVVRLLQRVGRAGHGPGRVRRGLVLTASTAELLEAVVTVSSGREGRCEPLHIPDHPLDVLCQQILGMAVSGWWSGDEAFALVRQSYPYRRLERRDFDACLDYLSGAPGGSEGESWLPSRLRWDEDRFTIRDTRTARLVRRNLGTILADEPCPVLLESVRSDEAEPRQTTIGNVEEAFVERLQPGDRFLLDGRCLEFRRLDRPTVPGRPCAVVVSEVSGQPRVPKWAGQGWPLSSELAGRIYTFRVRAAEALLDGSDVLADMLQGEYALHGVAVEDLVACLSQQECVSEIPDAATCLIEAVRTRTGTDYHVHTPLNRKGNDAVARVATARLARRRSAGVSAVLSIVADLGFTLRTRDDDRVGPDELRGLLSADGFDGDLEAALSSSLALRERFQRVALTGLMLLRNPTGPKRKVGGPGWGERRLFDLVRANRGDFVLLRQAIAEVRSDLCDAAAARAWLEGLPRLSLRVRWLPRPSPLVEGWTQTGAVAAEQSLSAEEALQQLHASLMGSHD